MLRNLLVVIALIVVVAVGGVAYLFFKPPEAASGPIEAIPITTEDETSVDEEPTTEAEPVAEAVDTAAEPESQTGTAVEESEPVAETEVQADTAETTETVIEAGAQTDPDAANEVDTIEAEAAIAGEPNEAGQETATAPIIFEIVAAESEARFLIDEVLQGDPITVIGATDQVAGQFAVNPNDLAEIQLGPIQVNARTLATDNQFRNRAIKNRILLTDQFEFVTFTPTEVTGLPEAGTVGESLTFQVAGDLTVTDVTRRVIFDITATAISETRLEGVASTAFLYTDYELFIPDAPLVDTVDDEVRLELDFVAEAVP